jgi:hypothetical protein
LVGVGYVWTIITGVTGSVAVCIFLSGICCLGTIVISGTVTIIVNVITRVVRAVVANISHSIAVCILLAWIVDCRAIIYVSAQSITVTIIQRIVWAWIAYIAEIVIVSVLLTGIGIVRAIVAGITPAVKIGVLLAGIVDIGAIINISRNTIAIVIRTGEHGHHTGCESRYLDSRENKNIAWRIRVGLKH